MNQNILSVDYSVSPLNKKAGKARENNRGEGSDSSEDKDLGGKPSLEKVGKVMERLEKKHKKMEQIVEDLRKQIKSLQRKIEDESGHVPDERRTASCSKCSTIRGRLEDIVYNDRDNITKEDLISEIKVLINSPIANSPIKQKKNLTIQNLPDSYITRSPSMMLSRLSENKSPQESSSQSSSGGGGDGHSESRVHNSGISPFKETSLAERLGNGEKDRKRDLKFFSSTPDGKYLKPPGYQDDESEDDGRSREEQDKQMPKRFPSLKASSMVLGKKGKFMAKNEERDQLNYIMPEGHSFLESLDASVSQDADHFKEMYSQEQKKGNKISKSKMLEKQNMTLEPMSGNDVSGGVFLAIPKQKRGSPVKKIKPQRLASDYTE